jgi:hypothetical protein
MQAAHGARTPTQARLSGNLAIPNGDQTMQDILREATTLDIISSFNQYATDILREATKRNNEG